ncbi:hypothetical protein LCGC14_1546550 [marine sediment metagenome]|uniref:Uncharacterized protein n=1 Tax=marine sediment metagenome TaxID=412755 RepID=A0A0F9JCF4_9ZZZZ
MTTDEMIEAAKGFRPGKAWACGDYENTAQLAYAKLNHKGDVIDFIGLLLAEIDDLKQTIDMAVEERKRLGKLRAKAATSRDEL